MICYGFFREIIWNIALKRYRRDGVGIPQWTWYKGKINRKQPGTTRIIMECGLMIVLCVHWASFLAPNCNENWHIYLGASSYQAHIVQLWQMFSIRCRPCDVNSKYFVTLIAHRSALINGTEGPLGLTQLKSLSWLWSSNVERTNLPWLVVLLGQNATKKGNTFSSRKLN